MGYVNCKEEIIGCKHGKMIKELLRFRQIPTFLVKGYKAIFNKMSFRWDGFFFMVPSIDIISIQY